MSKPKKSNHDETFTNHSIFFSTPERGPNIPDIPKRPLKPQKSPIPFQSKKNSKKKKAELISNWNKESIFKVFKLIVRSVYIKESEDFSTDGYVETTIWKMNQDFQEIFGYHEDNHILLEDLFGRASDNETMYKLCNAFEAEIEFNDYINLYSFEGIVNIILTL
jgi:hypothetical protein